MRRDEVGCIAWVGLRTGVFDGSRSISSQVMRSMGKHLGGGCMAMA